jgi:uncharacterized spore protein YtfJ
MRVANSTLVALVVMPLGLGIGCSETESSAGSGGTGGSGGTDVPASYAGNLCVSAKQAAAGALCMSVFDAWAA